MIHVAYKKYLLEKEDKKYLKEHINKYLNKPDLGAHNNTH